MFASLPRLFVDQPLSEAAEIGIEGGQAHYLTGVMRLKPGAQVKLFDDRTGEWLAEIAYLGKRDLILRIEGHLRPREAAPDLWLLAAPIKKGRIDWMAEKACELGVARLMPVITRRFSPGLMRGLIQGTSDASGATATSVMMRSNGWSRSQLSIRCW